MYALVTSVILYYQYTVVNTGIYKDKRNKILRSCPGKQRYIRDCSYHHSCIVLSKRKLVSHPPKPWEGRRRGHQYVSFQVTLAPGPWPYLGKLHSKTPGQRLKRAMTPVHGFVEEEPEHARQSLEKEPEAAGTDLTG